MLKNRFQNLCQQFSQDAQYIQTLYEELETYYTQSERFYHTLTHLEYIYQLLKEFKLNPTLEFAIFYHDIIYNVQKDDNELQSALLAKRRLQTLGVAKSIQQEVDELILSTKTHQSSTPQQQYFLDADLGILGANFATYQQYAIAIRKEYAFYSDERYKLGRQKVLNTFLSKKNIYLSDYFQEQYEKNARSNLQWEINTFLL